jgi:hypothetical protein
VTCPTTGRSRRAELLLPLALPSDACPVRPLVGLIAISPSVHSEFVTFDYEHSGWASEALRTQIALARRAALVPLVKSPGGRYEREGLLLDLGALGADHDTPSRLRRCVIPSRRYQAKIRWACDLL